MDILVYAVALCLIIFILYFKYVSKQESPRGTVPGPARTDPIEGHIPDMVAAGSMHEFLGIMHIKYGPTFGFWLGPTYCVSTASAELLREQALTFNRPKELFALFEPLITQHSIQYANGVEGRKRHTAYSRCFSHGALQKRYHVLQKLSNEFCAEWASLPDEQHIPLTENFFVFAIRSILAIAFGEYFYDTESVLQFKKAYDYTWAEMESRLSGEQPSVSREENFDKYKAVMSKMIQEALVHCQNDDTDSELFGKVVQEFNDSSEVIDADSISVCIGGFHTTGLLLTWAAYFLATNPKVQEKLYTEVTDLVGEEDIVFDAINQMIYMRQILDETMRCSKLATYAARVHDIEILLGGHKIPAGTPVLQAFGVMHEDHKAWTDPDRFDPERFSPENRKSIPSCGFEPFGFAGKRKCPGYRLSYVEASLLLGDLVRKFKFHMVDGQEIEKVYGLVSKPNKEIWITLEKRL